MTLLLHGQTGSHFLDRLSDENFKLLRPSMTLVELSRNEVLCVPGAAVEYAWFPLSAVLSVVTVMADGHEVEACTIGHESAYGLLNSLGAPNALDRVIAQVPGQAIKIPTSRLNAAAGLSLQLTDLIVRHAQAAIAQTQQSVACNAVHSVEQRLCRWLLMTQDRARDSRVKLTQEFLGFMLGVQRTTVTMSAKRLQAAGLIRYSRGRIEILDRDGLLAGACECYCSVMEKHAMVLGNRPFNASDPFSSPKVGKGTNGLEAVV